jgi:hypothetical protein
VTSLPLAVPVVGVQSPRVRQVPEWVCSSGKDAIKLAAGCQLYLDPWEADVIIDGCGEREDGKWAAYEVGIDVPRQNGKGSILEVRELAGLFIFEEERLLIHSAHEQATSSEHFRRLLTLIESNPDLDRKVLRAPRGKGAEAIELRDGSRIMFKTRTGGGARGLTGDLVVLDEAMILPDAMIAAIVPVMAARSIEGNPQLWYTGSAVDQQKHEHGVTFARLRARGMKGAPRVAWFEWSVPGDDPDQVPDAIREDPNAWAQANPGMGIRIAAEHIANECGGALGPREFAVERLGVGDWPSVDGTAGVLSLEKWMGLEDPMSAPLDPVCFAVDVTPDRQRAAIGIAGLRADGKRHIEIDWHRGGTGWVAARIDHLVKTHKPLAVVLDAAGPAASMLPALADLEIEVTVVNAKEHAQACGMFFDAYDQGMLRHLGDPPLMAAVKGAVTRPLGEAWAWSRKSSTVDISPLVAVTLALWGSATVNTTDVWMSF